MMVLIPPDVQRELDRLEPEIEKAFLKAISDLKTSADINLVLEALARGDVEEALRVIQLTPIAFAPLDQAITNSFYAGAIAAMTQLPKAPGGGTGVIVNFNARAPAAEEWTRVHSGDLIVEILEDQKKGIREFILKGVSEGRSPADLARDMVGKINRATGLREGGIIGLTSQQMEWVQNARAELSDPTKASAFFSRAKRDRNFDALVQRSINSGKPMSGTDIDRIIGRYSDRLLQYRGETIARTEAITAFRAGRHESWQQAIDSGRFTASDVIVEWSSTMDSNTRETHIAMHHQKRTFGQLFQSPSGALMAYPGDTTHGAPGEETINCRCMAIYRRRRRGDA